MSTLTKDLTGLLNFHGIDNRLNMPDFVVAEMVNSMIEIMCLAESKSFECLPRGTIKRIKKLEVALILHGEHSETCASRDLSDRGISFARHDWPCDCGLREALPLIF